MAYNVIHLQREYLNISPAVVKNTTSQPIVTANPNKTPASVIPQPLDKMCRNVSVGNVCG